VVCETSRAAPAWRVGHMQRRGTCLTQTGGLAQHRVLQAGLLVAGGERCRFRRTVWNHRGTPSVRVTRGACRLLPAGAQAGGASLQWPAYRRARRRTGCPAAVHRTLRCRQEPPAPANNTACGAARQWLAHAGRACPEEASLAAAGLREGGTLDLHLRLRGGGGDGGSTGAESRSSFLEMYARKKTAKVRARPGRPVRLCAGANLACVGTAGVCEASGVLAHEHDHCSHPAHNHRSSRSQTKAFCSWRGAPCLRHALSSQVVCHVACQYLCLRCTRGLHAPQAACSNMAPRARAQATARVSTCV